MMSSSHRRFGASSAVVAGLVAAILAWPTAAQAAAPPNDQFADAIPLGSAGAVTGDTTEAGVETGERCVVGCGPSVWYRWTSPASSPINVRFDTGGNSFDTMLSAWRGDDRGTLPVRLQR